jgi:hypothetical protein
MVSPPFAGYDKEIGKPDALRNSAREVEVEPGWSGCNPVYVVTGAE